MQEIYETIDILLDVYAYNHARKIAEQYSDFPAQSCHLLGMLKGRRELNVDFAFSHPAGNQAIFANYGVSLITNVYEEEQLANYIMDLEAKVKNGNITDLVRSVSPILYRLLQRLVKRGIPNLENYIHDTKNDQYDTWLFTKTKQSDYVTFHRCLKIRRDGKVTSRALTELSQYGQFPQEIKQLISKLHNFEKSVRSSLVHLIKPFDEEELHRAINFSSQVFLGKIITLATYAGIKYSKEKFYFDQANDIIKSKLKRNGQNIKTLGQCPRVLSHQI